MTAHGDVIEALTEALEYFEDRLDVVDGDNGEQLPNREMRLAQLCKVALARVDKPEVRTWWQRISDCDHPY